MKDLKQKVHGLYIGQKIFRQVIGESASSVLFIVDCYSLEGYIEVTPLHLITDEHAIEVAKICDFIIKSGLRIQVDDKKLAMYSAYNDEPLKKSTLYFHFDSWDIYSLDEEGKVFSYDLERHIRIIDFLRSNGYATPCFGHEVEDLVTMGIFKLREA